MENLNQGTLGLVFSQSVLLALVESGLSRDDAYRIVQGAAMTSMEQRRNFRDVIQADEAVALDEATLARAFDVERMVAHRQRFIEALTWR
jgi:adenylosuccinate lyase